jgi:hypothetical protein
MENFFQIWRIIFYLILFTIRYIINAIDHSIYFIENYPQNMENYIT